MDSPATFASLGLRDEVLKVLDSLGYEEPTPIQREAIPSLNDGKDILGQAATGTGKTAAFALPLLQPLHPDRPRTTAPSSLVLVPTRELAMQVSQAIHTYGRELGARVLPIYGGQPISRQLQALKRGVDVVVATPGRAIDHLNRGSLDLSQIKTVVLDEADEMLDMGFTEDIESILDKTPKVRQTAMFSATMPSRIAKLARKHLTDPVRIEIKTDMPMGGEAPKIREVVYVVSRYHKPAALARVLDVEQPDATIVFCRTRRDVDELTEIMNGRGYRAEALHGGMSQEQRDRVVTRLRAGNSELLVATDVAARGLDIDTLTHVVNHSIPSAPESYVHRIGRVGRAGREGVAISLVEPREHRALKNIERHTGRKMDVEKLPTVADLRSKQMELLRATLRENLLAEENMDRFRPAVESLADEFDLVEIALAAVKALHVATVGDNDGDDRDVPQGELRPDNSGKKKYDKDSKYDKGKKKFDKGPRDSKAGISSNGDITRVWLSLGREAGVMPRDLVGAITGETSLAGRDVGAINITSSFSIVEVPTANADEVIRAMSKTRIKGKKLSAKRDRAG